MIEILQQLTGWDSRPAADLAADLSAMVEVRNSQVFKGTDIVAAVGPDGADLVAGTMESVAAQKPTMRWAINALATVGIELESDGRQTLIDLLADAGDWPDSVRQDIKRLGRPLVSRWAALGGSGQPPSTEDIQAFLEVHAAGIARDALALQASSAWNAHIAPVLDGDNPTAAALAAGMRAAADAIEGA